MPRSLPSALGVPTWPRLRLSRRLSRSSSVKCPVPWWSRQRDAAAFEAEHSQNYREPTMTATTYRAVAVSKPGRLEVVERELTAPPPGKVRIRIEGCGVCRTDRHTVEGLNPGARYPRVPGHEVVGRIDALGAGVSAWKLGQRVGVGFLGGHCGRCMPCRRGDFVNCQNQALSGLTEDGGYAEVMIADERALAAVPAELAPADAARLLCAGVTTSRGRETFGS